MSADLVKFVIPAEFVTARVQLTVGELVYGFRHNWLSAQGVVDVAQSTFEAGESVSPAEEELALLLSDELDQVPALIEDLSSSALEEREPQTVWLYLALAWLHENSSEVSDPLEVIEMLYADFDYPDEIKGLVRFMPSPPGVASGHGAIEENWERYLRSRSMQYRARGRR